MKGVRAICPILHFGPLTLHTYGVSIMVGALLCLILILIETKRLKLDDTHYYMIYAIGIFSGILGSHLLGIVVNFELFKGNPLNIFKIGRQGMVFLGAPILAAPLIYLYMRIKKLPILKYLDPLFMVLPLGIVFGRIGCWFNGCCYGKPTDLPWAVVFTDPHVPYRQVLGIPVHPTQLYSAILLALIFFIVYFYRTKKRFDGELLCLVGVLYPIYRYTIELLRDDPRGYILNSQFLSTSQFMSIIIFISFGLLYYYLYKKNLKNKTENDDIKTDRT